MPRSNGDRSLADGAVVAMVNVRVAALVGLAGLKLQVDSLGKPVQVYVTGRTVCAFPPVVVTNPVVLEIPRVTVPEPPCNTDKVPLVPKFDCRVKL